MIKKLKDSKCTTLLLFIIFAIVITTSIMTKVGAVNTRDIMQDYVLNIENKVDIARAQVSDIKKELESLKQEIAELKSAKEEKVKWQEQSQN